MLKTAFHFFLLTGKQPIVGRLTVGYAFLLAVDSAAASATTLAMVLARVAVRREALSWTRQLLLVAGSTLSTGHSRTYNPTLGVPTVRASISGSIPASNYAVAETRHGSETRYAEAATGWEKPASIAGALGFLLQLGRKERAGFGPGRVGCSECSEKQKR